MPHLRGLLLGLFVITRLAGCGGETLEPPSPRAETPRALPHGIQAPADAAAAIARRAEVAGTSGARRP